MRGKLGNNKNQQEIFAKVTCKVVEDAKDKQGGSCKVTKTESEGNEEEVLSASVTSQVCLIFSSLTFPSVRYTIIEISHIIHIHEILVHCHISHNSYS